MSTPTQPIYLFADSQLLFWNEGDIPFLESIRASLTAERPKAAFIGASSGDAPELFELFEDAMARIGIVDCRQILSSYSDEDAFFLRQADLIVLGGGDIKSGWRTIDQTGMSQALLDRYCEGAVLIGIAAGAVQLGMYGYKEYGPSVCEMFETLKLVPFLLDTGDERNYWSRLTETIEQSSEDLMAIGIPSGCGLILHPDGGVEPIRSCVDLFVVRNGRLNQSVLAPTNHFPHAKATSNAVPDVERLEKMPLTRFFAPTSVFHTDRCA